MQSGTKKVLAVVLTITASIFIGSYFYYDQINKAEDPRILPAKELFQIYDKELESHEYVQSLSLLDQMLAIYRSTPGYENSYEIGVLLNNTATVYLVELETEILTAGGISKPSMQKSLAAAEEYTRQAIAVYEAWMADMGYLSEEQIRQRIAPYFRADDPGLAGMDAQRVMDWR